VFGNESRSQVVVTPFATTGSFTSADVTAVQITSNASAETRFTGESPSISTSRDLPYRLHSNTLRAATVPRVNKAGCDLPVAATISPNDSGRPSGSLGAQRPLHRCMPGLICRLKGSPCPHRRRGRFTSQKSLDFRHGRYSLGAAAQTLSWLRHSVGRRIVQLDAVWKYRVVRMAMRGVIKMSTQELRWGRTLSVRCRVARARLQLQPFEIMSQRAFGAESLILSRRYRGTKYRHREEHDQTGSASSPQRE